MNDSNKIEIEIQTLTPLWTGGEKGKCDRIHETGILGSLRWWMEVLVRGMGGNVSDPTEQECVYDPKKSNNNLCDVSRIFGATGWRRRFRLEVIEDVTQKKDDQAKSGKFTIKIQKLHPDFQLEIIAGLIQFIADWASFGTRSRMGYGFMVIDSDRIDTKPLYDWLVAIDKNRIDPKLPSLSNIFTAKIQPKEPNLVFKEEQNLNLKYELRQLFKADPELSNFIMGAVKGAKGARNTVKVKTSRPKINKKSKQDNRKATKIKISCPYPEPEMSTMCVWGWIPEIKESDHNGWNQEQIVSKIHQHLNENYTLCDWREMNSTRDTVKANENDPKSFLQSLLQLPDGD